MLLAIYSIGWEYSTRRYLKGFSDAIVPLSASPEGKVTAILNWMANGPTRQAAGPNGFAPDRDPTETLNYRALLRVCGSATNAFINLADSGGLETRRLLLLDSHRLTKHVVAEVLIDGRWIVVDPAYRVVLRGTNGKLLSHEELKDQFVFASATSAIPNYSSDYTYDHVAHIRIARIGFIGPPLRGVLDLLLPGWEDSAAVSSLLERESLATMILAITLCSILFLLRIMLRWYGEKRIGIHLLHIRGRLLHAWSSLSERAEL